MCSPLLSCRRVLESVADSGAYSYGFAAGLSQLLVPPPSLRRGPCNACACRKEGAGQCGGGHGLRRVAARPLCKIEVSGALTLLTTRPCEAVRFSGRLLAEQCQSFARST